MRLTKNRTEVYKFILGENMIEEPKLSENFWYWAGELNLYSPGVKKPRWANTKYDVGFCLCQ